VPNNPQVDQVEIPDFPAVPGATVHRSTVSNRVTLIADVSMRASDLVTALQLHVDAGATLAGAATEGETVTLVFQDGKQKLDRTR
jgi:hypothetical protein